MTTQIRRNIRKAIAEMRRNGTTAASLDCLHQNTPTTGVNVPVSQYRSLFDATAQAVAKELGFTLLLAGDDEFFKAYVECALWSSTDDEGEPLDKSFSQDDISPETLEAMRRDCKHFAEANAKLLENLDASQSGHDFWLTRNGHGAGFWDRNLGHVGNKLTEASKPYGSFDLYVVDGVIHG
jgi:hypothetical protein